MTDSLTLRQRFYLSQVFLGKTNVQIAREQGVSTATVKSQLHQAYNKLGISNTRQLFPLVILAQRENCTQNSGGYKGPLWPDAPIFKVMAEEEEVVA